MCGEGVDTRHAHAVETARDFIRALVELSSGMKHCHDDLKSRLVHLRMLIDRDTTTVILHCDGVVLVYRNIDIGTEARHGLVDRVIYCLVDKMVETFL